MASLSPGALAGGTCWVMTLLPCRAQGSDLLFTPEPSGERAKATPQQCRPRKDFRFPIPSKSKGRDNGLCLFAPSRELMLLLGWVPSKSGACACLLYSVSGSSDAWPCKTRGTEFQLVASISLGKTPSLSSQRRLCKRSINKSRPRAPGMPIFMCLETGGEFSKMPKEGAAAGRAQSPFALASNQAPFSGLLLFTSLPQHRCETNFQNKEVLLFHASSILRFSS